MVMSSRGEIVIKGSNAEVMADISVLLNNFYWSAVEKFGEETAKEMFAIVGRNAVMTDEEIEQLGSELIETLNKLM